MVRRTAAVSDQCGQIASHSAHWVSFWKTLNRSLYCLNVVSLNLSSPPKYHASLVVTVDRVTHICTMTPFVATPSKSIFLFYFMPILFFSLNWRARVRSHLRRRKRNYNRRFWFDIATINFFSFSPNGSTQWCGCECRRRRRHWCINDKFAIKNVFSS